MACMCGDLCCNSCGPAQGNWRCFLCGAWASDPCDHMDSQGAGYKPEFADQVAQLEADEARSEEEMYQGMETDRDREELR